MSGKRPWIDFERQTVWVCTVERGRVQLAAEPLPKGDRFVRRNQEMRARIHCQQMEAHAAGVRILNPEGTLPRRQGDWTYGTNGTFATNEDAFAEAARNFIRRMRRGY
jgi:hypothetical protein